MEKIEEEIHLRSEEFQEILGWIPPWILRWGITLLACIILILLIGSMLFKYPDIISAQMTLTGSVPTAEIVSRSSGKIKELFIYDNEQVTESDYLAVIENPAETKDILFLKSYLSDYNVTNDSLVSLPPKSLKVGTLQSLYTNFYLTLVEYDEFKQLNYYPQKKQILAERIQQYEVQYTHLTHQEELIKEQLSIATNQFRRDSLLANSGVISQEDLEKSRSQFLQNTLSYENILSSMHNLEIQIEQLKESGFENNHQYLEKRNSYISRLNTYQTQLETELHAWELAYAITAPVSGQITFTNYWAINQNVQAGETIFNIIPSESIQLLGKAYLPTVRSGKVMTGQKVNIRFQNFPDTEYGIVKGKVKNISLVPARINDAPVYVVEIELPEGLHTTYKKELPYLPQMEAQADIITEDISAFERIMMPLKKVLSEGF